MSSSDLSDFRELDSFLTGRSSSSGSYFSYAKRKSPHTEIFVEKLRISRYFCHFNIIKSSHISLSHFQGTRIWFVFSLLQELNLFLNPIKPERKNHDIIIKIDAIFTSSESRT